ncbi:hypothetical protein HKBW3S03_01473 [Candidatus Hakubella thermalkaliphila]|uniref:Uncharacterized protein n=1 Tax=Candidatus Hakubella thermalkaliphila TaxID=2754717 RepID=A0A6V8NTX7_9ACTN|nr:hypothetical protein HKBW3S03_01473 [Candidatus Hakubella thermalkaliphila]GFP23745.1 hypothetical protein HKBW3S09_01210 [Candidatus Hakubella thermalkaliphila]
MRRSKSKKCLENAQSDKKIGKVDGQNIGTSHFKDGQPGSAESEEKSNKEEKNGKGTRIKSIQKTSGKNGREKKLRLVDSGYGQGRALQQRKILLQPVQVLTDRSVKRIFLDFSPESPDLS